VFSWANIVIYFELPKWFEDFDKVVEKEDDPEDVKAIKRFICGDDQYRGERLKIFPALVDGPLAMKMLIPSKKEITIQGASLPLEWNKHPAQEQQQQEQQPTGETKKKKKPLKPCYSVDLNVNQSRVVSKSSSFAKRYMKSITLDLALLISKPTGQTEDEPAACLGLFRLQKIDLHQCPELPDRNDLYGDDDDDDDDENGTGAGKDESVVEAST